ncbi:MAG: PspC domain-containing protein, partial [Bacteroidales bacterium]|nr:PspC domain-containing protein [Bacteroidales bacterium]
VESAAYLPVALGREVQGMATVALPPLAPLALDADAAALAGEYLGELERHYGGREGGAEILEGIEERMAELLHEKCGRDGVVSRAAIEGIIAILGRPEEIAEEGDSPDEPADDGNGNPANEGTGKARSQKRKLFRDVSDKVVAGVCSGLGAYFQTDKVFFRLLFAIGTAVTFFGIGWHKGFSVSLQLIFPVLYVILWICMPPAKTVRQRWEQRGEDGTILGIQQRVESGANEVGEAIRSVGQSNAWGEIGRIIEKFIGVVLLVVGFGGLFAGGVALFGSGALSHQGWIGGNRGFLGLGQLYDEGMRELYDEAPAIAAALMQPWVQGVLILVVLLPFLGILYGALQMLFGFKSPKWHPGLVIFILWLMSIIAAGILIFTGAATNEWLTI